MPGTSGGLKSEVQACPEEYMQCRLLFDDLSCQAGSGVYVGAVHGLPEEARRGLLIGKYHQVVEKLGDAVALAVKTYAA